MKYQTKQANEDDEQEDWMQKRTIHSHVCPSRNWRDKVQLEMTLDSDCVVNLFDFVHWQGRTSREEGNIASDKGEVKLKDSPTSKTCSDQHQPRRGEP